MLWIALRLRLWIDVAFVEHKLTHQLWLLLEPLFRWHVKYESVYQHSIIMAVLVYVCTRGFFCFSHLVFFIQGHLLEWSMKSFELWKSMVVCSQRFVLQSCGWWRGGHRQTCPGVRNKYAHVLLMFDITYKLILRARVFGSIHTRACFSWHK